MRTIIFGDEMSKDKLEVETHVRNVGTAFTVEINNNLDIMFDSTEDYDNFLSLLLSSFDRGRAEARKMRGNLSR